MASSFLPSSWAPLAYAPWAGADESPAGSGSGNGSGHSSEGEDLRSEGGTVRAGCCSSCLTGGPETAASRTLTKDLDTLVQHIDDLLEAAKPAREKNLERLHEDLKEVFPNLEVTEYGSTATQMALPDSDLDCVVVPDKTSETIITTKAEMVSVLEKIVARLETKDWVSDLVFISTASMPVIKFVGFGGVHVDLTCLWHRHAGLWSQQFVSQQVAMEPALRPLALFLKQLLREKGLGDPLTGGLSSFSAVLIVASFLTWHRSLASMSAPSDDPEAPCPCKCSAGKLLLEFCEQHACHLDYSQMSFCAQLGYTARDMNNATQRNAAGMFVQDPFDEFGNVARATYRLTQFREELNHAWCVLTAREGEGEGAREKGMAGLLQLFPKGADATRTEATPAPPEPPAAETCDTPAETEAAVSRFVLDLFDQVEKKSETGHIQEANAAGV